jgi:uncharacterized membrane protein
VISLNLVISGIQALLAHTLYASTKFFSKFSLLCNLFNLVLAILINSKSLSVIGHFNNQTLSKVNKFSRFIISVAALTASCVSKTLEGSNFQTASVQSNSLIFLILSTISCHLFFCLKVFGTFQD